MKEAWIEAKSHRTMDFPATQASQPHGCHLRVLWLQQ